MVRWWRENGPPAYVTSAIAAGWKPRSDYPEAEGEDGVIESPDALAAYLSSIPGGSVKSG